MVEARGFEWAGLNAAPEDNDRICLGGRVGDDPGIGKAGEQRSAKEPGGEEEGGRKADKLKSAFWERERERKQK